MSLSVRAQTVLEREFGKLPTVELFLERANASRHGAWIWLQQRQGCGKKTALEIAAWAGLKAPSWP